MFPTPSGRKMFVVTCKRCRRDVPSGREEFPFQSIAVTCPLCGEQRRVSNSSTTVRKCFVLRASRSKAATMPSARYARCR